MRVLFPQIKKRRAREGPGHLLSLAPVASGHLLSLAPVASGHLWHLSPVASGHLWHLSPVASGHLGPGPGQVGGVATREKHTDEVVARRSLFATRMKLGLYPVLLIAVTTLLLLVARTAGASPRRSSISLAQEDALADGDIDPEDIAAGGALRTLSGATGGRPVLGTPPGSAWVSLLGFSRRTLDDRREIGGFIVLGLPLDRFARGGTRMTSPRTGEPGVTASPALRDGELDLVRTSFDRASLEHVSATETPFDLALTPRLARSCVAAAWRAAGLGADETRLDAIVSRARWSAVLPEARLRAVRFEDARLSLDTSTDTSKLRDSTGANVGFEARLTWRFDRLIYADDEPAFERIRLEHRDARARIGAKVLEALFHWQRAALDLRSLPPAQQGTRDEADVRLRLMEAEAVLDVLTNGWFGAHGRPGGERRGSPAPPSRGGPGAGAGEYAAPVPLGRSVPGDL